MCEREVQPSRKVRRLGMVAARTTVAERRLLEAAAAQGGTSLSDFVRTHSLDAAMRELEVLTAPDPGGGDHENP